VVEAIAKDLGRPLDQVVGDANISGQIDPRRYVNDKVGLPTISLAVPYKSIVIIST